MKLKLNIGQVLLTHQEDENFASVYEESFSKQGVNVDLFVIVEVAEVGREHLHSRKNDYEKLCRLIVGALKKIYISSQIVGPDTFETALASINAALARAGTREKAAWMRGLNAIVGAVSSNDLSLSATGNAIAILSREGQITQLTDGLSGEKLKPTKIFANFTTGGLVASDRIFLGNREFLNYLSVDRLREFLESDQSLDEACSELISSLAEVRERAFAGYIFETYTGDKPVRAALGAGLGVFKKLAPAGQRSGRGLKNFQNFLEVAGYMFVSLFSTIGRGIKSLAKFIAHFFRVRPKKYLFVAIAVVIVLFFGSIALASFRKSRSQTRQQEISLAGQIDAKLNEAEGALIYKDENKTTALVADAEKLLNQLNRDSTEKPKLAERLLSIKGKVSREIEIENPTVLSHFAIVPTEIVYSPNGFLGFNHNSGRLAFYDFREGKARPILENQNTSSLGQGIYLGSTYGYVFFDKDGQLKKLNLDNGEFTAITAAASADISLSDLARAKSAVPLGENQGSRLYVLDTRGNQIWRLRVNETDVAAPERWLKTEANLAEARWLAVDGAVFVLYGDRLDKYFNGTQQNWNLAPAAPKLDNAQKVFTRPGNQNLYILDPENQRILIYDKAGNLEKQFTSGKFRDLSDVYVDETAGLMYVLSGSDLLQINLK